MLLDAVVLDCKAPEPTAVFVAPVVFVNIAAGPIATLLSAVVFAASALFPTVVFEAPVVFAVKESYPTAVLLLAVVVASPAKAPMRVLLAAAPCIFVPELLPYVVL